MKARNQRRSRQRWLARVLPEDRVDLLAEPGPSLEQAVADRDAAAIVLRELARLEETDRVTVCAGTCWAERAGDGGCNGVRRWHGEIPHAPGAGAAADAA